MSATATAEAKRSWRGGPRGPLVRRSRSLWRWILSGLAMLLIILAVLWAWPRPLPRTMLLVLTSDREERTLPPVPFAEGDREALLGWARGAEIATCQKQLTDVANPADFVRSLALDSNPNRWPFKLAKGGDLRLEGSDTVVIYMKGHGLALDVSEGDQPDVRPFLVKSLSEADLAGRWFRDEAHVIDIAALLKELASIPEMRKLVIFDAVHLNYDPRLGTLVNSFPSAVKVAVEQLPRRDNLWVLLGQGDGELAVGLPGSGRSAFVDSLVQGLERKPKGSAVVELDMLVKNVQNRLGELSRGGRGAFHQELQTIFPAAGGAQAFALRTSPPPVDGGGAQAGKAKGGSAAETAVKVATQVSSTASTVVTGAQQVANSPVGKAVQPTAEKSTADKLTADKSPADSSGQPPAGDSAASGTPQLASTAAGPPAPAAAEPAKSDLDLAWEARDRLRSRYRDGWSPAHVAPEPWRHLEGLLAGFDEEELCRERPPRDPVTLQQIRRDLGLLEAVFRGESASPQTEECDRIAAARQRFLNSAAYRSFQAREASGFEAANQALKTLAEATYRACDYVRLHGQLLTVLDGGQALGDGPVEGLLDRLLELRGLFDPSKLPDGRLTDARMRELSRIAREVENLRGRIDEDIAAYARGTAAAPPSPGKLLRSRLLLHSPLLPADIRRSLRRAADASQASTGAIPDAASSSDIPVAQRLAANLRLSRKLLSCVSPATGESGKESPVQRPTVASVKRLQHAADSAELQAGPRVWAALGRQFRQFAEEWPQALASDFGGRSGSQPGLAAADMLDVYLATLAIDGRDARRSNETMAQLVSLVQPLRPILLPDRVELASSSPQLRLASPGSEGATLALTLRIQSEKPAPHRVLLDLNWNSDLNVTGQVNGVTLRSGQNELSLGDETTTIPLKVIARRDSKDAATSTLAARARFASGPQASAQAASAEIICALPRPDHVELTISADDNLDAARRRTWFANGQQGGRLNFFANREKTFNLYLTNLSSEEKKLHARLYRVPAYAAGPAGRLFDARGLLLEGPAGLDGQLVQPGVDVSRLLSGTLIAQTNEKEPVPLPVSPSAVKVPLISALAAPPPAATPGAAGAAPKGEDVTAGLLLVLTSADGQGKPYFKWIEMQMLPPDDLLEIREPALREGKLSFRVGLKDAKLNEEMGLAKQPLTIVWDSQSLPPDVGNVKKEATIGPGDIQGAEFSASVPATLRWPLYIQLYVDRDPRGLVVSLDRRGETWSMTNWKKDKPPVVHMTRLVTEAHRAAGQPEKQQVLIRPPAEWLPFPSLAAIAQGAALRDPGQSVLVRVDEKAPTVQLGIDLGADVAQKYFGDGARVRVAVEQQVQDFFADRQVNVRLLGIDGGGLQLNSDVSDFLGVELEPIDVKQDKRINLVADVVGERVGASTLNAGPDVITLILDRTPPVVSQLSASIAAPRPPAAPNLPPQTWVVLQCSADDAEGSQINRVEFVVGFDQNNNDRLDEAERRPAVAANQVASGVFRAEYALPDKVPSNYFLVEATATDNVGHVSLAARSSLEIPRRGEGKGQQRTTFGKEKLEEPPPGKTPGKKGR